MSVTDIKLTGLFALVRHIMPKAVPNAAPMTVVFPNSEFGDHGARHLCGGLHIMPAKHKPILFLNSLAVQTSPDTLPPTLHRIATDRALPDMDSYDLSRWQVWLPLTMENGQPVRHDVQYDDDEIFSAKEPTTCELMKKERFTSLSRLPNLNALTRVEFDPANLHGVPVPPVVESRTLLSGGTLRGSLNDKPLSRGFFEFFENSGTVVVQPALEDLLYQAPLDGEHLVIGFRHLDAPGLIHPFRLKVVSGQRNVELSSLPESDDERVDIRPSLQHFSHYYELMTTAKRRAPAVRFLGWCSDERDQLKHTMPTMKLPAPAPTPAHGHHHAEPAGEVREEKILRRRRTDEVCACFAAQAHSTVAPE